MPDEMNEQPHPPRRRLLVRALLAQALGRAPRGLRWSAYVAAALVLLMVLLVVIAAALVRRPVPVTDGELELAGLDADGRGDPRRPRHRPDLRRHRRRPDARPGLRRRAGPVLRDGRPSPRDRRAPRRALRRGRCSRPTSTSAPWAGVGSPSRSGPSSTPTTRDALIGLRRGRQRLPRAERTERDRRGVHRSSGSPGSTTSPSRGSRPTRWPGSRRWRGTCAATWTTRSPA